MRVLLVAYEFPPSPSPQSLRWGYLSRELEQLGVQLEVIAPGLPVSGARLPSCSEARVHRIFPGPFMGLLRLLQGRNKRPEPGRGAREARGEGAPERTPATLNWKGRGVEWMQSVLGSVLFPDIRGEWTPWAKRALQQSLRHSPPDVVVTSHEPANVLALGRIIRAAGVRWIADLGDPVLAPYTPPRWRRRARRLEAAVCGLADHITVTSASTRELLIQRHGVHPGKISVVTQGYDACFQAPAAASSEVALELLYTGTLYGFRRIDPLIQAVLGVPGIRLSIASRSVPADLVSLQERHPAQIRLLGALPHHEALARQRSADVLVDLGNDNTEQVPGKFYEYLGAMRPILHVGPPTGAAVGHLETLRRGWSCSNSLPGIAALLATLQGLKQAGRLEEGLDLGTDAVAGYSWQSQARSLHGIFTDVAAVAGIEPQISKTVSITQ